ncbi:MAG: PEGA domain-containing protein [Deltaproteobacteria bacterium]|nr:PEGA domain-containing protein [Deltaproteobacteria bacterium]
MSAPPPETSYDDASVDFDEDEVWTAKRRSRPKVVAASVAGLIALVLVVRALGGSGSADGADVANLMRASHLGTISVPPPPVLLSGPSEVAAPEAPTVNVTSILEKQKARKNARVANDTSPGERTQVFGAPHPAIPGVEAIAGTAGRTESTPSKLGAIVSPEEDEKVTFVGRGNVLVATVPPGAAVMLDGRFLGRTPMNVTWDLAQDAEVELVLADYETRSFALTPRASSGLVRIELDRVTESEPAPE